MSPRFSKRIRPALVTPLAVSAGMGFGLVFGASAIALSPAAASAIGVAITSVACSSTSGCIIGTNSNKGPGVAGTSAKGIGVDGTSTTSYGLFGTSKSGVGVKAVSTSASALFATSDSNSSYPTVNAQQTGSGPALAGGAKAGPGVYGTSSSGPGVSGKSSNSSGIGVLAVLDATDAPHKNAAALSAQAIDNGYGIYAYSQNYQAIYSHSDNDFGIQVDGEAGASIYGANDDGLDAGSGSGYSGAFYNDPGNGSDALFVRGGTTAAGNYLINAESANGSKYMRVDDAGNIHISGDIEDAVSCHSCTDVRVRAYAPHESEPTMEDVGAGRLVLGGAYIALDPAFRNVIDSRTDYHVLVTPEGDSNGVYVAQRSAAGFTVRENRGGRSSVTFTYRIVAKPYASTQARLPFEAAYRPAAKRKLRLHGLLKAAR